MLNGNMPSEQDVRKMVVGALGEQMAKFPVRFCKPIHFGVPPSREQPIIINSGTASLLRLRGEPLAVTCAHVIESYRKKLSKDKNCVFAIGNCYLDPLAQLIAEDVSVDAAVISLSQEQVGRITHGAAGIGDAFFELDPTHAAMVQVDDYVAFAGFPEDLRQVSTFNELNFGSYSSGACRVTDAHSDYLTCQFEREHWIINFMERYPNSLGGLSGGPAFVICRSSAGVQYYDFAGIAYQMHEESESLYIRVARAIPLRW